MITTPSTSGSESKVQFIDTLWPLLISIGPQQWSERNVAEMADGFERYFERGERYALISGSPRESIIAAKERKLITDWTNSSRVRERSRELCVGSATIVRSALSRGALTAMLWIWKPSSPHLAAADADEALDFALQKIEDARLPLTASPSITRREALKILAAT